MVAPMELSIHNHGWTPMDTNGHELNLFIRVHWRLFVVNSVYLPVLSWRFSTDVPSRFPALLLAVIPGQSPINDNGGSGDVVGIR
jgi:hypothetical protein